MWFFLLNACFMSKEPDLVVGPLTSQFVQAGEDLALDVDGLYEDVVVVLLGTDGREVTIEARHSFDTVHMTIPDVPPGPYTLIIRRGTEEDRQPLNIADPNDERPCQRDYLANTSVSRTANLSFVDRFYPDGRRERVEIALTDIEQLEYAFDEELHCAAILFRKTDGSSVLFEDSSTSLLERAQTLADYTGKPLRTNR